MPVRVCLYLGIFTRSQPDLSGILSRRASSKKRDSYGQASVLARLDKMRKILFLDIDGVLNNQDYLDSKSIDGQLLIEVSASNMIDPANVDVLNDLIDQSDADIVISSNWRHYKKRVEIVEALVANGFKFPRKVVGMTPLKISSMSRSMEIMMWLDQNGKNVDGFAVVDDNHLELPAGKISEHLVLTEFCQGLIDKHVPLLIEKMNITWSSKELDGI